MKSSRRSSRCQRILSISRMSLDVYLVQSLNRSRPLLDSGMTPPLPHNRPANSPQSSRSWLLERRRRSLARFTMTVFGCGLFAKAFVHDVFRGRVRLHFAELFRRHFSREGRFQRSRLARFLGLRPATCCRKYLIGFPRCVCRKPHRCPDRQRTAASGTETTNRHFGAPATLIVARIPIVVLGAIGCIAASWMRTIIDNWRVGTIAAIVLMFNPLYRRTLSSEPCLDVPCEAFMFVAARNGDLHLDNAAPLVRTARSCSTFFSLTLQPQACVRVCRFSASSTDFWG